MSKISNMDSWDPHSDLWIASGYSSANVNSDLRG